MIMPLRWSQGKITLPLPAQRANEGSGTFADDSHRLLSSSLREACRCERLEQVPSIPPCTGLPGPRLDGTDTHPKCSYAHTGKKGNIHV